MSRKSLVSTLGITISLMVALSGCAFENLGKTEVVTVDPETHFMEIFDEDIRTAQVTHLLKRAKRTKRIPRIPTAQ